MTALKAKLQSIIDSAFEERSETIKEFSIQNYIDRTKESSIDYNDINHMTLRQLRKNIMSNRMEHQFIPNQKKQR